MMQRISDLVALLRSRYGSTRARIAAAAVLVGIALVAAVVVRSLVPEGAEVAAAATAESPGDSAAQAERGPAQEVVPVARPAVVKGIYLNAWAAGSPRKRAKLIELARRTEINTFVIDVKEGGFISYRSQVPLARELGLDSGYIKNVRDVLQQIRDAGIYPIARIVVFKDPVLATKRPDWAIQHVNGGLWTDNKGKHWVDSFNRNVWDYNIAIAREAVKLGFAEVQWDYVRFPDVPPSYKKTAVFPAQKGRTKEDAIREFLLYSREQLADLDVPVTADVFGLTVTFTNDMGIGQHWEKMVDATDVLLPMVYPSHYRSGNYGLGNPNAAPYETVYRAMQDAIRRSQPYPNRAAIRPWLQDFTLGPPRYGATQVRAQIRAVYDAGLEEWILWNPGSNYTEAALLPEGAPNERGAADGSRGDTVGQGQAAGQSDAAGDHRLAPKPDAASGGTPVAADSTTPPPPPDTTGGA